MYFKENSSDTAPVDAADITPSFKSLLIITAVLLIIIGLMPSLITDWLYF